MMNQFFIIGRVKTISEFDRYDKPSEEFLEHILKIQIYINTDEYQDETTTLYIKNENMIDFNCIFKGII